VLSGAVTDDLGAPLADASVFITSADGVQLQVRSDSTGHYTAQVHGRGPYTVMFVYGKTRVTEQFGMPADGKAVVDAAIDGQGEIIEVHESLRPLVYAKPRKDDPRADPLFVPSYSDQAFLKDAWTKAWLLLDIDERGNVARAKFLKRPGYDLDDIAIKHVFGLRFEPARNARGVPARSYVAWPIEWPSISWLMVRDLLVDGARPADRAAAGVPGCGADRYRRPCQR
jgi:hypothetical protein